MMTAGPIKVLIERGPFIQAQQLEVFRTANHMRYAVIILTIIGMLRYTLSEQSRLRVFIFQHKSVFMYQIILEALIPAIWDCVTECA